MTRINLIPVEELMDQHLVAEYRELPMIGSALERSLASPNWNKNKLTWPEKFTLNAGHVKFFYDKGLYLKKRYDQLVAEMKARGMNPNPDRLFKSWQFPSYLYEDWEPSQADMDLVRERIALRISTKPSWYRKTPHVGQLTYYQKPSIIDLN
jgi:deoxyribonuclease (pyrimidine dimer)